MRILKSGMNHVVIQLRHERNYLNRYKVSNIDEFIGNHMALGDKLYFRTLSPMGLFECYSLKLKGLFWIAPENVSISLDFEDDKQNELDIPKEYKVFTMFQMMLTGWDIHMQNISKE